MRIISFELFLDYQCLISSLLKLYILFRFVTENTYIATMRIIRFYKNYKEKYGLKIILIFDHIQY